MRVIFVNTSKRFPQINSPNLLRKFSKVIGIYVREKTGDIDGKVGGKFVYIEKEFLRKRNRMLQLLME